MKVAVILGTRPEIIKMAPVIRELEADGRMTSSSFTPVSIIPITWTGFSLSNLSSPRLSIIWKLALAPMPSKRLRYSSVWRRCC